MAERSQAARRAYHSPLRADQAQQTRRRVLESARRLFVERGYAGTTVAAVADHAGVSPETIYLSLGGKRGLLEGVMDITGPHDSVADDESGGAWSPSSRPPPSGSDKMVEYSCRILARTRPSTPSSAAPQTRKRSPPPRPATAQERLTNQTERIRRYLGDDLRPGLSVAEAGERYCALASPELYHLLTVELALDRRAAPGLAHPAPPDRSAWKAARPTERSSAPPAEYSPKVTPQTAQNATTDDAPRHG